MAAALHDVLRAVKLVSFSRFLCTTIIAYYFTTRICETDQIGLFVTCFHHFAAWPNGQCLHTDALCAKGDRPDNTQILWSRDVRPCHGKDAKSRCRLTTYYMFYYLLLLKLKRTQVFLRRSPKTKNAEKPMVRGFDGIRQIRY